MKEANLNPTQQQLSAVLHSRLTGLMKAGTEAFKIVASTEGNGLEAWRKLNRRFEPQTDQHLAARVASYKIKPGADPESGVLTWETMLRQLYKDTNQELPPIWERAPLIAILPPKLQLQIFEHLDRLKDYD